MNYSYKVKRIIYIVHRPSSKFAGRAGRVGRSSDVGRFWDTQFETIYQLSSGSIVAKTDYFNDQGLSSALNHEVVDAVSLRRKCELPGCNNAEMVVDHRGYAHCSICNTVYNDGKPPLRTKTSTQILNALEVRKARMIRACKG